MSQGDPPTHAGGVVYRDGWRGTPEYLLVSSSTGSNWVLPKGHIEAGETPEDAARREVLEEAGVVAEIVSPLGVLEYDKEGERVRAQYFLMRATGTTRPKESRDTLWVPLAEVTDRLGFPDARRLVEEADRRTRGGK